MIVIVEGARATGKTYLIERLQKEWSERATIVKQVRGEDPTSDLLAAWSRQLDPSHLYLWDRAHLTEYVMSTLLKRRSESSLHVDTVLLSSWLRQPGTLTIVLFGDPALIRRRLRKRQEADRKQDVPNLAAAFEQWRYVCKTFLPMGGPYMISNPKPTKESYDQMVEAAIENVKRLHT